MKKRSIVLAVFAAVLVLASSIGAAVAYFTTYVTANGGYVIHIENETHIHEDVGKGQKVIRIENTGEGPVFVRVKAFNGDDFNVEMDPESPSTNWEYKLEDGYWYYRDVVNPGDNTSELTLKITDIKDQQWEDGDVRNVIVIYESVPAYFDSDGNPDFGTAWSNDISSTEVVTPITIEGGEDKP